MNNEVLIFMFNLCALIGWSVDFKMFLFIKYGKYMISLEEILEFEVASFVYSLVKFFITSLSTKCIGFYDPLYWELYMFNIKDERNLYAALDEWLYGFFRAIQMASYRITDMEKRLKIHLLEMGHVSSIDFAIIDPWLENFCDDIQVSLLYGKKLKEFSYDPDFNVFSIHHCNSVRKEYIIKYNRFINDYSSIYGKFLIRNRTR